MPRKHRSFVVHLALLWAVCFTSTALGLTPAQCVEAAERISRTAEQEALDFAEGELSAMHVESRRLTDQIRAAQTTNQPYVVEVLGIGAGPHSAAFFANLHAANPGVRTLVFEAANRPGTFAQLQGFDVNTRESAQQSGNIIPGLPIQPRDLNVSGQTYVPATNFGAVTILGHRYAQSNIVFGQRVGPGEITERPAGANWPARYRIVTQGGLVVYANHIVTSVGMGRPRIAVYGPSPHQASMDLIARQLNANAQRRDDPSYAPGIQAVDDLLPRMHADRAAGRDPLDRYGQGTFAMVGGGDGGSIAIEGIAGLNAALNPGGQPNGRRIHWIGQKAKNKAEFLANQPRDNLRERYGRVGDLLGGSVTPTEGRVVGITELSGPPRRFQLIYEIPNPQNPSQPTRQTVTVDHVVFAAGYEQSTNRQFVNSLFQGLSGGNPNLITHSPVPGDRGPFTNNPSLNPANPVAQQLVIGGRPQNIYVIGHSATGLTSAADFQASFGGNLEVRAPLAAAFGHQLGSQLPQVRPLSSLKTSASTDWHTLTVTAPENAPPLYGNLMATRLAARIEAARFLNSFSMDVARTVSFRISREGGTLRLQVQGLDPNSTRAIGARLIGEIEQTRLRRLLMDIFHYAPNEQIRLEVRARADGQPLRTEDMIFTPVVPRAN